MVIDIYIQSQIPMEILYVNASHTSGSAHAQEGLRTFSKIGHLYVVRDAAKDRGEQYY